MSSLFKEKAKARMLQNAASIWGIKDSDIEVSFDPLVTMLIEGCVNELEKLNNDIRNTDARIIKRLAQLVTPDVMTGYRPAHAIVQARPAEESTVIKPELQLYYTKTTQGELNPKTEVSTDIYFSPVSAFRLLNISVKYMAFHDGLYENANAYNRKIVAESETLTRLERGCVWLGIDINELHTEPGSLCFYFDLKNNTSKSTFLNMVPHTRWSLNGKPLTIRMGLPAGEANAANELNAAFDAEAQYMDDVLNLYTRHFITVAGVTRNKEKVQFPECFGKVFPAKDLQKLSGKCLWISVEFNPAADLMLPDLVCGLNCFPVVNKKLNELTFRLSKNLNIVPLKSADYFYSVKSLYNQEGMGYTGNPLNNPRNLDSGTYLLRHGNIERFDSRDSAELINYLLDLLRDESGAFSVLGNEFISSGLKQLNQTLSLIEQRMNNQQESKEAQHYLFISPFNENENVFVSFWSTNGQLANNIKAGNKLELYASGELRSESLVFVTTTISGRAKLNDVESLSAFKSAQLSRDRIVTQQDIRMACFHELGSELDDVTVEKGFAVSSEVKSGFIQTVNVKLKISRTNRYTGDEWADICEDLSARINKNSTGFTPVRVMIENVK